MKPMVLVVDDDEDVRESLRDMVSFFGRDVVTAENGRDALGVLKRVLRPCLILLDLVMPQMDGWHFLEALRGDPALKAIPVVIVSAHAGSQPPPSGIDGLLPKPIDLTALRRVVAQHCPG